MVTTIVLSILVLFGLFFFGKKLIQRSEAKIIKEEQEFMQAFHYEKDDCGCSSCECDPDLKTEPMTEPETAPEPPAEPEVTIDINKMRASMPEPVVEAPVSPLRGPLSKKKKKAKNTKKKK